MAKACGAPPHPGAVTEWPAIECDWFEAFDSAAKEAEHIWEERRQRQGG